MNEFEGFAAHPGLQRDYCLPQYPEATTCLPHQKEPAHSGACQQSSASSSHLQNMYEYLIGTNYSTSGILWWENLSKVVFSFLVRSHTKKKKKSLELKIFNDHSLYLPHRLINIFPRHSFSGGSGGYISSKYELIKREETYDTRNRSPNMGKKKKTKPDWGGPKAPESLFQEDRVNRIPSVSTALTLNG